MKIKIKWISEILKFIKGWFIRKYCLFEKPFPTLLILLKVGREEDEKQVDKCNIEICKKIASPEILLLSKILPLCENIPHTSDVTQGLVTAKVPVVLTECCITITIKSSLKLEDEVLEIKQVRKNVYLNKCKLIPNSKNDKPNNGILFLSGFIRNQIEYSTKEHNDKEVLKGNLKHSTVNIPFEATTRVTFNTPPNFKTITSQDIKFFNEKVFCKLISAEFIESDILENPTNKYCKSPLEQTFHDITQMVVMFLTIELLQNQNVIISK